MPMTVMLKTEKAQIPGLGAAAMGEWLHVVDLQQMF